MLEIDKDQLEGLVTYSEKLYLNWRDCLECQYNQYVCADHQPLIEPLLRIWAWSDGHEVEHMQINDDA